MLRAPYKAAYYNGPLRAKKNIYFEFISIFRRKLAQRYSARIY